MAKVPLPTEGEGKVKPAAEHHLLDDGFKVKPCKHLSCIYSSKCRYKLPDEQGFLEYSFHPQGFPCQRDAVLLHDIQPDRAARDAISKYGHAYSISQIGEGLLAKCLFDHPDEQGFSEFCRLHRQGFPCESPVYGPQLVPMLSIKTIPKNDVIQLDRSVRDAVSKYGHNFLSNINSGSTMFKPSVFAAPSTVVAREDLHKSAHQYYLTKAITGSTEGPKCQRTTSGSCKLVVLEFRGTSTVGRRMPLVCAVVDAWRMAGGGSAQTDPDHGMLVEPDDLKLDSGASNHVVCEKTLLQGYESLVVSWYIHVADDYPLEVVGIGYIITKEFFIPNVYRVRGLKENLISVSQLARDHGLFAGFHGEICEVLKRDGEKVGGGFMQANGLYKLSFLEVPEAEAGYEGA